MIVIKNHKVLRQLLEVPYYPTLIGLALWVTARYSETTFTSGYRKEDKGVHGTDPCRGIDIRSKDFDDPKAVEEDINAHWTYDPERPEKGCALFHDVGRGEHIHLQVHPRTKYIGG